MSTDELQQEFYMMNERCFHVDENDQILGTLSKYDSHRIDPVTGVAPLHRAFSLFLFRLNPHNDTLELLLQQRSQFKLTFPLLWANTCCSHPIEGLQEDTEDVITGIVKAARRKLEHELGIPSNLTEKILFIHCNRIHYHANQEPWGEHEIDHIILTLADDEIVSSINANENEVRNFKFVPVADLKLLDRSSLTPWLQKIISTDLLGTWIAQLSSNHHSHESSNLPLNILKTKYSTDPIIKL